MKVNRDGITQKRCHSYKCPLVGTGHGDSVFRAVAKERKIDTGLANCPGSFEDVEISCQHEQYVLQKDYLNAK